MRVAFRIPHGYGLLGVAPYAVWFHVCFSVSVFAFVSCLLVNGRKLVLFWGTVESSLLML